MSAEAPSCPAQGEQISARQILAAKRSLFPRRSWLAQAEAVYIALLALGIFGVGIWQLWESVITSFGNLAGRAQHALGASALLLLLVAVLRYSVWQGFVAFSEPDCAFLLTAPAPRSGFVLPRLRRASLLMAVAGAIVAVLATLVFRRPIAPAAQIGQEAAAGFALGIVLVAAGWHAQRLLRVSRWVFRLTLPAFAVAVLLALAEKAGGSWRLVALWSGPWGWATLPVASSWAVGAAGLLLLWLLATAAWISQTRTAGGSSLEGFRSRARTRSRAMAGLYSFDARTVVLTTRQAASPDEPWWAHMRLAVPRSPRLAVPWHAVLALLRSPFRLAWGLVLGGGGMLLLAEAATLRGAAWGGALALYLAASSLLEPLRLEVDAPAVSQVLLPWRFGRVLWRHCLPVAAVLIAVGLATVLCGWAAGVVPDVAFARLAVLIAPVTFAVVLAAALSARRGGTLPASILLLTAGDSTGMSFVAILGWLFWWAILAIVSVASAVQLLARPGHGFGAVPFVAAGFAILAALLRQLLLVSRR